MYSHVKTEFETSVTESQQNSGAGGVDDRVINCIIMMHSSVINTTLCSGCPSSSDEGYSFLQLFRKLFPIFSCHN